MTIRGPLAVGGGLIAAGLVVFVALLDGVRESADLSSWDSPVLRWLLTHRTPTATSVFTWISWLGDPPVLGAAVLVLAALLVRRTRRRRPAVLLVGAMGLALVVSAGLKAAIARPRPPVSMMIAPAELDFAFPSWHTIGTAVVLLVSGYVWWTTRRTTRTALVALTVSGLGTLTMATSRLYLGYHWLTDITASIALAVVILGIVIVVDSGADAVRSTHDRPGTMLRSGTY